MLGKVDVRSCGFLPAQGWRSRECSMQDRSLSGIYSAGKNCICLRMMEETKSKYSQTAEKQADSQSPAAIFLHIPKTAGTTLLHILDRQYAPETIHSFGGDAHASVAQFRAMESESRAKIRLLRGHMAYGLHQCLPDPVVYFTILRNPAARVISYYNYILRTPAHYLYEEVTSKNMSLHDLMESRLPLMMNDGQVRLISGVWGEPGFGEVTPAMLETAKKNLADSFVVVGLTEQFDKTLCLLKENLNWQQDITYERLNVSPQGAKKDQISAATVDLVQRANQQDIALYAYAQDLFAEQCAQRGALFDIRVRRFQFANKSKPIIKSLRTYSVRTKLRTMFK